jgi:hypothetical protein
LFWGLCDLISVLGSWADWLRVGHLTPHLCFFFTTRSQSWAVPLTSPLFLYDFTPAALPSLCFSPLLSSLFLAANTGWAAAPSVTSSPRPLPATSAQQVCPIVLFCSCWAKEHFEP